METYISDGKTRRQRREEREQQSYALGIKQGKEQGLQQGMEEMKEQVIGQFMSAFGYTREEVVEILRTGEAPEKRNPKQGSDGVSKLHLK